MPRADLIVVSEWSGDGCRRGRRQKTETFAPLSFLSSQVRQPPGRGGAEGFLFSFGRFSSAACSAETPAGRSKRWRCSRTLQGPTTGTPLVVDNSGKVAPKLVLLCSWISRDMVSLCEALCESVMRALRIDEHDEERLGALGAGIWPWPPRYRNNDGFSGPGHCAARLPPVPGHEPVSVTPSPPTPAIPAARTWIGPG